MIAWEESPHQFKMSKQLDEGKFGEDLAPAKDLLTFLQSAGTTRHF